MIEVFVAIGSNLADPRPGLVAPSPRWQPCRSPSCGRPPAGLRQPPHGPCGSAGLRQCRGAPCHRLSPLALLDELQRIEQAQGRVRKDELGPPRPLDLDLLLYGDEVIRHERLTVPHYGMKGAGVRPCCPLPR